MTFTRRTLMQAALGNAAALAFGDRALAQVSSQPFPQWVESFRPRALAKGVSDATYSRVMGGIKPDTSVYQQDRNQPEFKEQLWQYLNRRVSDWRIITGKERAKEHAALLARIEKDFGVEPLVPEAPAEAVFGIFHHVRSAVELRRHLARLRRPQQPVHLFDAPAAIHELDRQPVE